MLQYKILNIPVQYNANFDMVNTFSSDINKQYTTCDIINNSYSTFP
jgi:hypothetical protein